MFWLHVLLFGLGRIVDSTQSCATYPACPCAACVRAHVCAFSHMHSHVRACTYMHAQPRSICVVKQSSEGFDFVYADPGSHGTSRSRIASSLLLGGVACVQGV